MLRGRRPVQAMAARAAQPQRASSSGRWTHLGQAEAVRVDEALMGPLGFSVDQLMELAGLSVAVAVAKEYPIAPAGGARKKPTRVVALCGPGNNGGDGMVAARHLHHFGYAVDVVYPKPTDRPLYNGLVTQCKSLGLRFLAVEELLAGELSDRYDVVLDALFGFSFKGPPRPPFDAILAALAPSAARGRGLPPIASVDVPSGWHVEDGDVGGAGLRPDLLVSLTAPKLCARTFSGTHYLGGRFVPPAVAEEFSLELPAYPGTEMCVKIAGPAAG